MTQRRPSSYVISNKSEDNEEMPTRDNSGVTFAISEKPHHLRLLELPREILDLLALPNPPVLSLKSQEDAAGNAAGFAVLCTPDKSFQLRQVSTSNTVYIARPGASQTEGIAQPSLEAIAQSTSTLELHHVSNSNAAVFINAALPKYGPTRGRDEWTVIGKHSRVSKRQLFDSIPLSVAECEQGWDELTCFESPSEPGCFIPNGVACTLVWESMLSLAVANGIDLTGKLTVKDMEALIDDLDEWTIDLPHAIFRSIGHSTGAAGQEMLLDKDKCLRFVCASQLEALGRASGRASLATLVEAAKDALPEKWRDAVDVALFESIPGVAVSGDGVSYIDTIPTTGEAGDNSSPTNGKAVPSKRKWHDKFRQSNK